MNKVGFVLVGLVLLFLVYKLFQTRASLKKFDVRLTAFRGQVEDLEKRLQRELHTTREHLAQLAKGETLSPSSILEGKKFADATPEEARQLFDNRKHNYLLIFDVRTPQEYAQSHLPGAELVPLDELEERLEQDDREKDRPILVYCSHGNRSSTACELLTRNGFLHVYNLSGGITAWRGPVETGLRV